MTRVFIFLDDDDDNYFMTYVVPEEFSYFCYIIQP